MKHFVFRYKRLHWFLIFFVNMFMPLLPLIHRLIYDVFKASSSSDSLDSGDIICGVITFVCFFFILGYVLFTIREHKGSFKAITNFRFNLRRFCIGSLLTVICGNMLTIFFIILFGFKLKKIYSNNETALKALGYSLFGISVVLCNVSNVFLNLFECKFNFDFFRQKYQNTLIKDVITTMNTRKRRR